MLRVAMITMVGALAFGSSVNAAPSCLRGQEPFKLDSDVVRWTVKIAPGADCIQGIRWSYMQIYDVEFSEHAKNGRAVLVGPGFRYYASQDFRGADRFTMVVYGKNRHDVGKSTIEVTVTSGNEVLASAVTNVREHSE